MFSAGANSQLKLRNLKGKNFDKGVIGGLLEK